MKGDDVMPLELPDFGQDTSKVSAFTEPGHEIYARLFLPLAHTGTHRYVPWRVAADRRTVTGCP
jgi:hypothetical protein